MTGVTYSVTDYENYNKIGDSNYFEDVIDKMILDGISGMNDTFKNAISNLSKNKKRMTILSLLDKDLNLFKRIKALTNKNINKMEHIKDIILMLREYVKIGEVEKKKFGEVMTPLELVKEMLSTLPEEVWSNPNLKWLDPANGTGPYPIMVIYKLMNGLKDWEPDEEKRYKHIVENMIYVSELQPKNMFLYMCAVDPFDSYELNIYTGSFLEEGFDYHMKNVWNVDKFDICLGNPPYNNEVSISGTSSDIYDKFIIKSDKISFKTLMIVPTKWFSKPDKKLLRELLIINGKLEKIITNNKAFDELNIRGGVSYFLTNQNNNEYVTFNGELKNLKSQYKSFGFILNDQKDSDLIKTILNKMEKNEKLSSIFNSKSYFGLKTNHSDIHDNGIKCYFSSRQKDNGLILENGRYYSFVNRIKDSNLKLNRWKLITPAAYGFKTKTENTYNKIGQSFVSSPGEVCTETFVFFDLESENECKFLKKYLQTKFVQFLISLKKSKQDVTSKIFEIVPKMKFDREWTDEQLFDYFNLTEDERKIILNFK
jgi:site-specific DNA-methyltransferase (adenine-specific)